MDDFIDAQHEKIYNIISSARCVASAMPFLRILFKFRGVPLGRVGGVKLQESWLSMKASRKLVTQAGILTYIGKFNHIPASNSFTYVIIYFIANCLLSIALLSDTAEYACYVEIVDQKYGCSLSKCHSPPPMPNCLGRSLFQFNPLFQYLLIFYYST